MDPHTGPMTLWNLKNCAGILSLPVALLALVLLLMTGMNLSKVRVPWTALGMLVPLIGSGPVE